MSHRIVVLLAIALGTLAAASVRAEEPATLRVATYNINWGNADLPAVARTIRQSRAALVCLQETTPRSERFLRRQLAKEFPHVQFTGHQGRYAAERLGFLSKHPLSDLKFVPPAAGLFGAYFATVRVGGVSARVANVHLSPFLVRRGGVAGALRAFFAVEDIHKKEIAAVFAALDPQRPTIIAGDFNSPAALAAPAFLKARGFTDSFASVTQAADGHPTWHWPLGDGELRFRIDYVFHTRHFKTQSSAILPSAASDHYLLVSELALPPRPLTPNRRASKKRMGRDSNPRYAVSVQRFSRPPPSTTRPPIRRVGIVAAAADWDKPGVRA